jgi:DNA polymerase-3 subunit alpha
MFGALEFSEKLASYGIQPIIGCALAVDFADQEASPRNGHMPARPRLILLAGSDAGYRSLLRLNSRAFLETPSQEAPHIKLDWLAGETDGLIALTGGPGGPLDTAIAAGQGGLAAARLEALMPLFGDRLYVELQRHGLAAQRITEPALTDLAYAKEYTTLVYSLFRHFVLHHNLLSTLVTSNEREFRPVSLLNPGV